MRRFFILSTLFIWVSPTLAAERPVLSEQECQTLFERTQNAYKWEKKCSKEKNCGEYSNPTSMHSHVYRLGAFTAGMYSVLCSPDISRHLQNEKLDSSSHKDSPQKPATQPLDQNTFLQRIRDGQVEEISKEFLTRSLYIKENPDLYPPEVVQQAEEALGRAQRYYEQRRQAKQDSVSPVFEGATGEFQPTPAMEKSPEQLNVSALPTAAFEKMLKHIKISKATGKLSSNSVLVNRTEVGRLQIEVDNQLPDYEITKFVVRIKVGSNFYEFKSPPNLKVSPYSKFKHIYKERHEVTGTIDERIVLALEGRRLD